MDDTADEKQEENALADLIEVERHVLEAIREAETEAERAIEEVEAELEARASEGDVALEDAVRELRAQLDLQRREALVEIERCSTEATRRYRDVDEARIDLLAAFVARRVAREDLGQEEAKEDGRADPAPAALPVNERPS